MARTIRWIIRALYPPPVRQPTQATVNLEALEAELRQALAWVEDFHPDPSDEDSQAQEWINWLDETLHIIPPDSDLYRNAVSDYLRLCRHAKKVPAACFIGGDIVLEDEHPLHQTALSDVYCGIKNTIRVALKSLRVHGDNKDKVQKAFLSEVAMWRCLRHPNIVPFLGISLIFPVCLVSEWMAFGSISSYLSTRPSTNRLKYVKDILAGLDFMHSLEIVHGDLKAANVLVDVNQNACLSDFGLAKAIENSSTVTGTATIRGTLRWMAPELLQQDAESSESGQGTPQSDMYAVGMVFWEMFTGRVPFDEIRHEFAIYGKVLGGERPLKPQEAQIIGLSDDLWDHIEWCWEADPGNRPSCREVLDSLE